MKNIFIEHKDKFCQFSIKSLDVDTYEPGREKTCFWVFRPGLTQTRLYSHRRLLEA